MQNQEEEDGLSKMLLELPPPMKPISKIDENCIQSSNPSASKALDENDLAEIEQIVKEKMVSLLILSIDTRNFHFNCKWFYLKEKHEASSKHPQSLSPQVSENEDVSIFIIS